MCNYFMDEKQIIYSVPGKNGSAHIGYKENGYPQVHTCPVTTTAALVPS